MDSEKLVILGVAQEQHSQRTKLYKQWKQYDFPIVQDATTQLNLQGVPVPILIDEHGIVRSIRPWPNQLAKWMEQSFDEVSVPTTTSDLSEIDQKLAEGNRLLHQKNRNIDGAIAAFTEALKIDNKNGKALFSLGVAYRMRFDSDDRDDEDFSKAAKLWSQALAQSPNQYIWRRRIEQYGPRLTKPYPFYDWVKKAETQIRARGEEPSKLTVALTGTEVAKNGKWDKVDKQPTNPDPDKKIFADEENRLSVSSTTVPAIAAKGQPVRIHLDLSLDGAFWNDEAEPAKIWIEESSSGTPEQRLVEMAVPLKPSAEKSAETRTVDFEFRTAKDQTDHKVNGYVLFHCCDQEGVCYYFRKDFTVSINAK